MKKNYQGFKNLLAITLATTLMIPTVAMAGGAIGETDMIHTEKNSKSFTVWGDKAGLESPMGSHEDAMKYMNADLLQKLEKARMTFSFDKDIVDVVKGDVGFMDTYGADYTIVVPRGTTISLATTSEVERMWDLKKTVAQIDMEQADSGRCVDIDIKDITKLSGSNAEAAYKFSYLVDGGVYVTSTIKVLADYRGNPLCDMYEYSYQGKQIQQPQQPEKEIKYVSVTPTSSKVLVNGKEIAFQAYNIAGNNYFKLRDLAMALNGTEKSFSVTWDDEKKAIAMTSGAAYDPVGGELTVGAKDTKAAVSASSLYKDGKVVTLDAYTIGGNTYFKLRDIGQLFDFAVNWNGAKNCIEMETTKGYSQTEESKNINVETPQVQVENFKNFKNEEFRQFSSLKTAEQKWVKQATATIMQNNEEIYNLLKDLKKIKSDGGTRTVYENYRIDYYADEGTGADSFVSIEIHPKNGTGYYYALWAEDRVAVSGECKNWNWDGQYEGEYGKESDKGLAKAGRREGKVVRINKDGTNEIVTYENGYCTSDKYEDEENNCIWTPTRYGAFNEWEFKQYALWD